MRKNEAQTTPTNITSNDGMRITVILIWKSEGFFFIRKTDFFVVLWLLPSKEIRTNELCQKLYYD